MNGEILKAATIAVGKTIAVCAVGFFMSRYPADKPLMDTATRKGVGRILLLIMVPCLAASSLSMTVTPDGFANMYPMWGWCFISLVMGCSFSFVMASFLGLTGAYKRGFIAAGTFGNNVGLPLIILASLCKQTVLEDYGPYETCREVSYGMIMFYGIPWRVAMFGIAVPLIAACNDGDDDEEEEEKKEEVQKTITSPNADEMHKVRDSGHGLTASFKNDIQNPSLTKNLVSPVAGGSIERENLLGGANEYDPTQIQNVADDEVLVLGDEEPTTPLAQEPSTPPKKKEAIEQDPIDWLKIFKGLLTDVNIIAPIFGVVVGLIPALQEFLFGDKDGQPTLPIFGSVLELLGEPVVAFATLGMASALLPKGTDVMSFFTWKVLKEVIALCSVRFALVPGIGLLLVLFGHNAGIPGSRLQWLCVIIQFCLPSPQVLIVSMVAVGKHKLATRMAPVYVVSYLFNIVSLTIWTSVALSITEDYDLGLAELGYTLDGSNSSMSMP